MNKMRHFVNLALVPFFLTLVATGLMRFLLPFSLVTTRIHIIAGITVLVLVALHLASRVPYFKNIIKSVGRGQERKQPVSNKSLIGVLGLWIFLLGTSLWDLPPASQIIGASYESRHKATIFRSDPRTVYQSVGDEFRLKRVADSIDASLLVQLDWSTDIRKKYGQLGQPFTGSRPQIAIWAEGETGTLIETLYLSEESAFNENFEWAGLEQRRVDVLPIWRNRFTLTSGIAPDGEQAEFFSGATPEHSFAVHNYLKTGGESFYLYVEINFPGDPNDYFNSNKKSDEEGYVKPGIGQPSVLYGAYVTPEKEKQYMLLDLVGHGGSSNSEGSIHYNNQHLTSAKDLVEKILVRVKSVEPEEKDTQAKLDS